jgi:hypothetical protein
MKNVTKKVMLVVFIFGVLAISQINVATPQTEPASTQWVDLSFRLPAIGNIEAVKTWEYGRIASMSRRGADDVLLTIRDKSGQTRQVVCPAAPFADLARVSNWMTDSGQSAAGQLPTTRDCIERMVAFSADNTDRVIGLASLEPLPRRGRRIADAFRR